jgi:hypothetical protein
VRQASNRSGIGRLLFVTPDEFAQIQRTLDQRALEQVAMLRRIGGFVSLLCGIGTVGCFLLLLLVMK